MEQKDWPQVEQEIFAPIGGADPDAVAEWVVEDEMSLFNAFSRQNKALGG